ncbi:MAG: hypothetical protein KJ950_04550 [Proteobacteria bacterium]|nr:hypothetical protein [Pseudomonadota bacterium]MBU1688537.1 hypothetical protein [Pseudomonadota bacterium]
MMNQRYPFLLATVIVAIFFLPRSAVGAYYLDAPHNESNGIYCYTCHTNSAWWWTNLQDPDDPTNPDATTHNAICLGCHDPASVTPLKGPAKAVHASSTTDTSHGTWSTQCTECHDPHYQGQLDWLTDPNLYLATGDFNTGLGALDYNIGGNYTTIGFGSVVANDPDFNIPASWYNKSGNADEAKATDGSRGLILAFPDSGPRETYEIIGVSGNVIKVKGNMTGASSGVTFGVIYGDSIRSYMWNAHGNGYRDIKFFTPNPTLGGEYGGLVDRRPTVEAGTEAPVGLCQVCHTATTVFTAAPGAVPTHYGSDCNQCHTAPEGFKATGHGSAFIGDVASGTVCATCHGTIVADPTSHANGCSTCHGVEAAINTNVIANESGRTVYDSLTDNAIYSWNGSSRLQDGSSRVVSDALFTPIECDECHQSKPAAIIAMTHGIVDHSITNGSYIPVRNTGGCTTGVGGLGCHNVATGSEVIPVTHKVNISDIPNACYKCHDSVNGFPWLDAVSDATAGTNASIGNGVGAACADCHPTRNSSFASHTVDHAARVLTTTLCVACHDGDPGTNTTAPNTINTPFVGVGEVHGTGCSACHQTDGTLQSGPNGDATGGAGACADCHVAFNGHSHHTVTTSTISVTTSCATASCHDTAYGGAGTARIAGLIPFTGNNEVHETLGCATCHDLANGGALQGSATNGNGGDGVYECADCHNATWASIHTGAAGVSHATKVTTATCDGCHTVTTTPYIGQVHANCATCHNTDGSMRSSGLTKADQVVAGACTGCHTNTSTWETIHSASAAVDHSQEVAVRGACTGVCHTATGGFGVGQIASLVNSSDDKVHDSCGGCHNGDGTRKAVVAPGGTGNIPANGGDCSWCHGSDYFDSHVHGTDAGYVSHTVGYLPNGLDGSAGTTGDNDTAQAAQQGCGIGGCHNAFDLTTWNGIRDEHDVVTNGFGPCNTCHKSNRTVNISTGYTSVGNVIATAPSTPDPSVSCDTCHEEKTPSTGHGNIDHTNYDPDLDTFDAVDNDTSCTPCHYGQTGAKSNDFHIYSIHDINDATLNPTGANNCGICHLSPSGGGQLHDYSGGGSTLGDNVNYEGINGGHGGICGTCHTPYAAGVSGAHNVKDHDQLGNQTECLDCHANTLGTEIQSVIHSAIGCSGCHDSGAGYLMKAGASSANHTYGTTDTCTGCHNGATSEFNGTTTVHATAGTETHVAKLLGNTNCTTAPCHQGNVQTVVHAGGLGCQNCHNTASDGTLINSASAHVKGVAQDCTQCHSAIAANFTAHNTTTRDANHASNITGISSAKCTDCHDPAGTKDILVDIHGTGASATCTTCHNASYGTTNGTLIGSAGANHTVGSPSDCVNCHVALSSDFTAHTSETHSARLTGLGSAKCTTCHDPAGTLDIILDIHDDGTPVSVCDLCHLDTTTPTTDGRFVADTAIATISNHVVGQESGCITCHPAFSSDFAGAHDIVGLSDHNELSTSGAAKCTNCHGIVNIIPTIHKGTCDNCHTDTVVAGGTDGTLKSWALNHNFAGTSNCLVCHVDHAADFGNHATDTHDAKLANWNQNGTPSKDCDNCHTAANGTAVRDTIHSINTCDNCHVDPVNDGSLRAGSFGNATLHTIGVQSNCTTCHGVGYFQYHTYGNTHTGITYDEAGGDTAQSGQQGCGTAGCHNDAGTNLANWAAIKQEHDAGQTLTNGCVRCHDYDGTNGDFNTVDDVAASAGIANGPVPGENCRTCHTDKVPNLDHGGHVTGDFSAPAICQNCHSIDVVGTVHPGSCGTCHESVQGGSANHVLIGSAANVIPTWDSMGGTKPHLCTACHTDATPDHKLHHHKTEAAQLGRCDTCHDASGSVDMMVAPKQLNCVSCHINDTGSQLEVLAYDLTQLNAANPTDPYVGVVASHTIVYEPGVSSISIYDYRFCLECHSGENPNADTAPVIKPFHGYPGDWTKGYLYAGAGQLPGLGLVAPAAYNNGLDDINSALEMPWLYQYYHPGPGIWDATGSSGIRRFNDAMVVRKGSNNQRLYQTPGAILNPNTDGGNKDTENIGHDGGFKMVPGNEDLGGGLDVLMAKGGAPWSNKNYSLSFTVPCVGGMGWCNDGNYTEVPRWADVASGDVIKVVMAQFDGTTLSIEATNSLAGAATLSISNYDGTGCSGNLLWDTISKHYIDCGSATWTSGDTITITSSAGNTLPVTVAVNDAQGAGGPAPNSLSVVTSDWVTSGDGAATGTLIVTATVDNSLSEPTYTVTYQTLTNEPLTWNGIQSKWLSQGVAFEGLTLNTTPGALRVWDPTAVGDNQLYTVTDLSDVVTVSSADYDNSTKLLNVVATEAGDNPYGSCAYYATYNSTDYPMNWTGTQLELVDADVSLDPGFNSSVTVHCASLGGDSVTYNSVSDSTPTVDDAVTITSAAWTNNGNGAALGSIFVTATHTDGDGVCSYSATYNGSGSQALSWNGAQSRYEATITNIAYTATINTVEISGAGTPCDTYAAFGSAATNLTDVVTVTQADHDGSTLTVAATESAQLDCGNTYLVDYNGSTSAAMGCTAGALTLTWNSAPTFVGGNVMVYSATAGGDSKTLAVTDTSGGGPVDHAALGHVTFAALATETCANCHSGDPVVEVHKNDCTMCHTSPPTLIATMPYDTDTSGTKDPIVAGTCGGCHMMFTNIETGRKKTWYHHYSDNAQGGNCVHCHSEARVDTTKWNAAPEQVACAYCHINYERMKNNDGAFELKTFSFVPATDYNTPLTSTLSDTHTIPNLLGGTGSPVEIQDMAVCFNCHDTTDMMSGMIGAPTKPPKPVRPYHASGIGELANLATVQDTYSTSGYTLTANTGPASDPGTTTPQIPLDYSTFYNEAAIERKNNAGCSSPGALEGKALYDNVSGEACKDDRHWVYRYHPGRGGITDTSGIIMSAGKPVGSFNVLFNFISPALKTGNPKYYLSNKNSESGSAPQNAYKGNGVDSVNGSNNYASCNSSYTDSYGTTWNFCGYQNVPYNQWTPSAPGYWVTVPAFANKVFGTDLPNITDEIRITSVDCGTGAIAAYTKLTEDYHLGSQAAGTVKVQINGGTVQSMTYNSGAKRWEYTGSCSTGNIILVTSTLGDGLGTASITAP